MVLTVDNNECSDNSSLCESDYQELSVRSRQLLQDIIKIDQDYGRVLYVGQREMVVVGHEDDIDIVGSDLATTCHIVIMRHEKTGVTAMGHIDNDNSRQISDLVSDVIDKVGGENGDIHVSLIGGYNDSGGVSAGIREVIMNYLIHSKVSFILGHFCVGDINTIVADSISKPRVFGAAVDVKSGKVFCASFSTKCRGPDLDVRSLRLYNDDDQNISLLNIYRSETQKIVIEPFQYQVIKDVENWCQKSDQYLLRVFSTSPEAEHPDFLAHLRNTLETMKNNPQSSETLFPGGMSRQYTLDGNRKKWKLHGRDLKNKDSSEVTSKKSSSWSVKDFRLSLSNL